MDRPAPRLALQGSTNPTAGDAQRLWNTAAFIAEEERWSRVYRGRRGVIDTCSAPARSSAPAGAATTGGLPVESVEDWPESRRNATASDHRPVLVDITAA